MIKKALNIIAAFIILLISSFIVLIGFLSSSSILWEGDPPDIYERVGIVFLGAPFFAISFNEITRHLPIGCKIKDWVNVISNKIFEIFFGTLFFAMAIGVFILVPYEIIQRIFN